MDGRRQLCSKEAARDAMEGHGSQQSRSPVRRSRLVALTPRRTSPTSTGARLEYNRHIQVWKIGVAPPPSSGERYCVLVKYQGSWTTIAGDSPNNTGPIPAGIDGTFGGAIAPS